MLARTRLRLSALLLIAFVSAFPAQGQSPAAPAADTILHAADAGKLLPPSVFFKGQSAPVQSRNSGGIKFADGSMVLVTLVDSSGYSTAVQQKYQAYFINEVPVEINGHALPPGAYGVGFVEGKFGVMDIGGNDIFSVAATHDAEFKRPTPLQILADSTSGHYRLYEGRDSVVIARSPAAK